MYAALTAVAAAALVRASTVQAQRFAGDALERLGGLGEVVTEGTWKALFAHTLLFFALASLFHAYVLDRIWMVVQPTDLQMEQWKLNGALNIGDAALAMLGASAVITAHASTRYRLF